MRREEYEDMEYYGYPFGLIAGDKYYDETCGDELWKPIDVGCRDYWISNYGRIYSFISDKFLYGTPTGKCGHLDVSLHYNGKRIHRYIHRLVAEAFIPNPNNYPLVRHLNDDPSDNYVGNLAWGTSLDNVRDCINNNNFRYFKREDIEKANEKRRTPIKAIDLLTGEESTFRSQIEAARSLGMDQSDITSVVNKKNTNANGYYFALLDDDTDIDISNYKYSIHFGLIKATNIYTGDIRYFKGQTEAARSLGMSIASISMILSGKSNSCKGYTFEYVRGEKYGTIN